MKKGSRTRKSTVRKYKVRKYRGGVAPVSDIGTILTPQEQSMIFLNPAIDNWSLSNEFLDSRTPLLNTAIHSRLSLYGGRRTRRTRRV
jgi:hypothetical protein